MFDSHREAASGWFKARIRDGQILLLPGAYDAFSARVVESSVAEAIYVGGYATVAATYGLPDVGLVHLSDMAAAYERIALATTKPLVVDIDTGYGGVLNVERTVQTMRRLGVAAVHIEDQENPKRCGHIGGKRVVPIDDAVRRVATAVDASRDGGPAIIARTDALAVEGIESVLRRGEMFAKAGADALFVDAVTSVEAIEAICSRIELPLVFNAAPTGVSPSLSPGELQRLGVAVAIYPVQLLMAALTGVRRAVDEILGRSEAKTQASVSFADLNAVTDLEGFVSRDAAWSVA